MRKFKQITITLHEETLQRFREYCSANQLPLSRFLGYAGLKFIKMDENSLPQKLQDAATPTESKVAPHE